MRETPTQALGALHVVRGRSSRVVIGVSPDPLRGMGKLADRSSEALMLGHLTPRSFSNSVGKHGASKTRRLSNFEVSRYGANVKRYDMGLGGYLAARSDAEHYASERAREVAETGANPAAEAAEVSHILRAFGLTAEERCRSWPRSGGGRKRGSISRCASSLASKSRIPAGR
jgi:hypothetical protein